MQFQRVRSSLSTAQIQDDLPLLGRLVQKLLHGGLKRIHTKPVPSIYSRSASFGLADKIPEHVRCRVVNSFYGALRDNAGIIGLQGASAWASRARKGRKLTPIIGRSLLSFFFSCLLVLMPEARLPVSGSSMTCLSEPVPLMIGPGSP